MGCKVCPNIPQFELESTEVFVMIQQFFGLINSKFAIDFRAKITCPCWRKYTYLSVILEMGRFKLQTVNTKSINTSYGVQDNVNIGLMRNKVLQTDRLVKKRIFRKQVNSKAHYFTN